MKLKQKLLLGLSALLALAALWGFAHRALAVASGCQTYGVNYDACSSTDVTKADSTYQFTSNSEITAQFGTDTVTFTDKNPFDGDHSYLAPSGTFCSGGHGQGSVTITNWNQAQSGAAKVDAQVDIDYYGSSSKSNGLTCQNWDGGGHKISITNTNGAAKDAYQWDNNNIVSNDGSQTLSVISSDGLLYGSKSFNDCGGGVIVLNPSDKNKGTFFVLVSLGNHLKDSALQPALRDAKGNPYFPGGKCFVALGPTSVNITGQQGKAAAAGGTAVGVGNNCTGGTNCVGGTCQAPAGGGTPDCFSTTTSNNPPTCESNFRLGLEWLVCPIIKGIDGLVVSLYGFIEDSLCFPAGSSTTAGAQTCGNGQGSSNFIPDNGGIHNTWALIKNISSAMIVIIMLVVVIGQAVGTELMGAYTVRKALPKLVAAVILIQLSWVFCKWSIDISNDVGKGLAALLYAPFPPGVQSIDVALGKIGVQGVLTGVGIFGAIAAAVVISGITVVGVGMLALSGLLAVVVGFFVLFMRQMLIIFSIIFVPLALVAWILPGTNKYWTMWKDNFIKLLAMYPLIVGIIAIGRIFGYTAGTSGNHAIFGLIAVLIGFFGPLFILPKTYKWGGAGLSAIGSAAWDGTKKARNWSSGYALNQAKVNREQRGVDRAERLANNQGRRFDSLWAGRYNLGLERTARRNRYQDTLEKGRKASDEAAARAVLGGRYEQLDHPDKVGADTLVAQGRLDDEYGTGLDGRHAATQRAALERLAKYGDWDAIAAVREGGYMGEEGERVWQQFVAAHIGDIHKNMPHLSPQRTDLSQVGHREFFEMKDDGWDELLRQAEGGFARDAETGALIPVTDPAAKRAAHIQQATKALKDDQFMAGVGQHGRDILKQIEGLDALTPDVTVTPTRDGVAVDLPSSEALRADPAGAVANLNSNVMHANDTQAKQTRVELARHLSQPGLGADDRQIYENYLLQLKDRAGSSEEARKAYNEIITSWQAQLRASSSNAERAAAAAGSSAADIATARTNAQNAANAERQRMIASGLSPV